MCPTQSVERYHDYPIATATTHSEYLYTTEHNPTCPKIPVGFQPVGHVPTQPTLEPHNDVSSHQLGEQERAYVRTEAFREDDLFTRLGIDLGIEPQGDGSSPKLSSPQSSNPSPSDPSFPLCGATAQVPIGFDDVAYTAALDEPLPTNTGWDQVSQHISGVTDMSFTVPDMMFWPTWSDIPANEGFDGQGSTSTALDPLSLVIPVPTLPPPLLLVPQENTINSGLTSLQPPQLGRPRARTAPTVFRDTTPSAPLFYPPASPISIPPSTPHSVFSSECESSPSTSPFSQSRDLPSFMNHPGSSINPRLRSSSVSTTSRGRPLTRPRRMVERVLDPARVRPHPPAHVDAMQAPISGGISFTPQHLDVPLFEQFCGGSDVSEYTYTPDSPSTPSNLSRASSTGSVHRRPRSRSRSGMPYTKPSSSVTLGDGTSSPEHPKSEKNRRSNGRDEFPGQRLHLDERLLETALADNPSLRVLLDNILESSWRKEHGVEPNYEANNDDVSQGLELPIEPGSSVLLAFIFRTGDNHTCVLCKEGLSTRVPRQLGHVRGHIDLRPFPCEGCDSCDPTYPARFFSRDLLQDHHRSSKSGKCPHCGEKMRQHNLRRHIQAKHQFAGGGTPYLTDATTQWEVTPFLLPPTLESYGLNGPHLQDAIITNGHLPPANA